MKLKFNLLFLYATVNGRFGVNPGGSSLVGAPTTGSDGTWKYTEAQSATPATPTTKDWHQFVNNKGITNWDDHLREQGIDPQANQASGLNPDGTEKEQWYNPILECRDGLFNEDTAPLVGTKTKYLATPGWPTRTMGVFDCKWTIKRDPSVKYIKLTFNTMDFHCNGLIPKVKSWGTANHIKIWDGQKIKTIDCGRPKNPPFYSTSDSIDVQIQLNAAGYGEEAGFKGGKIKIMYQSVRQKGTPILRPTPPSRGPTPPLKTLLPRHGGRIMNPQDPAVLNDPNHIQNPRRGLPLNHQPTHQNGHQRPQISNQRPQVSLQQPIHHPVQPIPGQPLPPAGYPPQQYIPLSAHDVILKQAGALPAGYQPMPSHVHGIPQQVLEGQTTTPTPKSDKSSSTKTVSLAFGIISMILILIIIFFIYKKLKEKCRRKESSEKNGCVHTPGGGDVVQFVNDLVSGKAAPRENEPHLDRTATTTTTVPDSDPPSRRAPPPRPQLPLAAVKINSLEPQKSEVSKWDD